MNENFLKELESGIIERLSRVLLGSEDYKHALAEEKTAYERLTKELTEGQRELLEEYCNAASISTLLIEKTAYKQGVADLVNLLISNKGEGILK